MTSSQHGPYAQGDTRATMASTMGSKPARASKSQKAGLSSDCRLQFACMKLESLVMAHQPWCREYAPPVKPPESVVPEVVYRTAREETPKVKPVRRAKS